jgi:DNA/RNA-binding domain of Phe-tRNA-synthetase-like protein
VFCDALGPHGSPTSDSERTMVTSGTKHVLAVIISFAGEDALNDSAHRLSQLLADYAGGKDTQVSIIT